MKAQLNIATGIAIAVAANASYNHAFGIYQATVPWYDYDKVDPDYGPGFQRFALYLAAIVVARVGIGALLLKKDSPD